ncbi:EamA family transporter, partial [Desulfovibrio sp. OttesenSCG-928-G15]|nr:EamA family transporter [Desulfovibrio sp. OttesenSCG-928-G15]
MSSGAGELAALATAAAWGISSQVQSAVGGLIGTTGVTLLRQPFQIAYISLMCLLLGASYDINAEAF